MFRYLKTQERENYFSNQVFYTKNMEWDLQIADAPGGTRKAFLLNLLLAQVRKDAGVAAIASSGIAVTLLEGGRTAHSLLKLPLNSGHQETPICNIGKNTDRARMIQECKLLHARTIYNDTESGEYSAVLLKIGENHVDKDVNGMITLGPEFCNVVQRTDELVYPDLEASMGNKEWLCERVILARTNEIVGQLNNNISSQIVGDVVEYLSIDTVLNPEQITLYPMEFLNSLEIPGVPSHRVRLKVGVLVLLMRNLDAPRLCNGTTLQIKHLGENVITAEILSGKSKGENVFARIPLNTH